jgi:signal transduction histidine kinase
VYIETTNIYDLALPVAETDVETATGSAHILGYVLVNYEKTHWRSVANRVWIESVSITAIISLILLLVLLHVLGRITKPLKILALLMLDPETAKQYRMASISGVKEVRDISTAYNDLMQALKSSSQELVSSYEHLEERVNERTEELIVARDEAAALNVENRLLIRTMNATVEEERRYIARELHDHIDALLLYVKMGLSLIGNAWSQVQKGGVREETWIKINNTISETQKTISTIYDSSRSIVQMLRPEVMDSIGLVGAIEQRVALIRDTHPGCKYLFSHNGDFADLEYTSQMALFRIAQESLTNAAKHSHATEVVIELRRGYKADPNGVVLMIADNGDGFDTSKTTGRGTGLIGMRERAYSIGGKLGVHSTPGEGTIVTAKIPFDSHELRQDG